MIDFKLNFTPEEAEFTISDRAAERIIRLQKLENKTDQVLQIGVDNGGCAGFVYTFEWAKTLDDGKIFSNGDAKVYIRNRDIRFLDGGSLDFIETLISSKFEIYNPNASDSCSCGKSFA